MIQRGRRPGSDPTSSLAPWLGSVIRQHRIEAQLSQQRLAELAGISELAVTKVEGGRTPRLGVLEAIARALGVRTSVLVVEAEELAARGDG